MRKSSINGQMNLQFNKKKILTYNILKGIKIRIINKFMLRMMLDMQEIFIL